MPKQENDFDAAAALLGIRQPESPSGNSGGAAGDGPGQPGPPGGPPPPPPPLPPALGDYPPMPPIQPQNPMPGPGAPMPGPGPGPGMPFGQPPPFRGLPNPPPPGFPGPQMPMPMPPLPHNHPQAIHARAVNAAHGHMPQPHPHQGCPPYPPRPPHLPPPPRREMAPKSRKDKFPVKLMEILTTEQYGDSISWLPHGRSFIIHSPERFTATVLPKYFKSCKFSSFTRKLYRWGFRQISKGPDAESFFHKHFRRDKKTLCNMIVCGKEIRDGCPELHEGINAHSLMRLEQAELRDTLMQQRQVVMARQNLARQTQNAFLQQGQPPSASGAVSAGFAQPGPAIDPLGGALVGAFSTQDIDALKAASNSGGSDPASVGAPPNGQEAKQEQQPEPAGLGITKPSQPGVPQILAPSGQPINSQNQQGSLLPPLSTSAPVPSAVTAGPGAPAASLQNSLPPPLGAPDPSLKLEDGSLAAIAVNSDPIEIQARIDAMQSRILELKRRQLAELEAKHAELQLLEAEEQVRIKRRAAANEGARAEAFEKSVRLRHDEMVATGVVGGEEGLKEVAQPQASGDGGGNHPLPQLPPVAIDTDGGTLGIPGASAAPLPVDAPVADRGLSGEAAVANATSTASEVDAQGPVSQTLVAPAEEKVA